MENIDKKKHLLFLNRSFWPDIEATGQFLTELCEELTKKYRITVIVGCSYYKQKEFSKSLKLYKKEIFKEIEILRVRHTKFWKGHLVGRMTNWVTYCILTFIMATFKTKPTLIIAGTDPPFLGIVAMLISRLKSIPFIYNCQDLFPDIGIELGKLRQSSISRIFDYFNKKALTAASVIVCAGPSMEKRLMLKGIRKENMKIITSWVDTATIKPVSKQENPFLKKHGLLNKFIIMYSGNIGLSQDFSIILSSLAEIDGNSSFYVVFAGSGSWENNLREKVRSRGLKNVLFLPYQPKYMLSFSLSMADLHIVPLKKGMAGAIVPSKVYGIMAAGRPYLAITDKDSEPARLAEEFGCGLWVSPEDTNAIAGVFKWALNHPAELKRMGRTARWVAETKFDKNIVVNKWLEVLNTL